MNKTFLRLKNKLTVGKDVPFSELKELVYTVATTSYPPYSVRYRFEFSSDEVRFFYTRKEGKSLPLRDEDIVENKQGTLTEEQKKRLFESLSGGKLRKRKESITTGDSGPWVYLYCLEDFGKTEFSFEIYLKSTAFLALCNELIW